MEGYNNNEFHGYGGNTASDGVDRDFDEPLNWKYPALQDLEWEGTLISLPPKLTSLSDNFAPNVLPLSETTATPVPPMLPPVEDVTNVPPNPQDQLPALQNINGGNNTDDYRQTQFRVSTANQVAPLLHAEVELPCSPQDQMPALQNINSRNNTDDYRQTQFRGSTVNHVAPMLPAEVEFSGSQINHSLSRKGNSSKSNDCRRWTEEEHRLFLGGLQKYGKSDWINISRFIKTKTPTQVASHAQKYFIRQAQASTSKGNKGKRRSIHDIVLPDNGPVPHRIYQQSGVSFPTLDGPIPHHIHHQNGVPFPNPTRQQLYETHLAVFRYMIQQNWFLDQLKQIYQK